MESNVSLVILAIVFVLLIVILPVYNVFTRQDDMSYNMALKTATNFVDKVRTSGRLTYEDYTNLLSQLSTTGNSYQLELEACKKYLLKQGDVYKEVELIEYTDTILKKLETNNFKGVYTLEKGERFCIRIKNTNITNADSLLSSIKVMDSESKIDIDYSGVVLVNSFKE